MASYIAEPWINDGDWAKQITVRQLLVHTSGLSNSVFPLDKKIYFEPGTKFSYAGIGYAYLTKIIEQVTSQPFDAVARAYVFSPMGMSASAFDMPFVMLGNVAYPHSPLSLALALCLGPFLLLSVVVYLLGLLVGLATRFRYYSRPLLLNVGLALGAAGEITFALFTLPKLIIPVVVIGLLFALVVLVITKISRRFWLTLLGSSALFLAAGLLPLQVPFDVIPSEANAAYSLSSTAPDLGKFAEALFTLDQQAEPLGSMLSEQVTVDAQRAWGYGIGIEKVATGVSYWHSGINPGVQTLLVIDLEHRKGIVVLTNSNSGATFMKDVAELVLGMRGKWDVR